MTKSYVYIAIRDDDGKEHLLPPFVTTVPETLTESEKIADMKLKLKNIGEVLDYLNTHID